MPRFATLIHAFVIAAFVLCGLAGLASCRSSLSNEAAPAQGFLPGFSPASSLPRLTVHVSVPSSQSHVTLLKVSDSLYGVAPVGTPAPLDPKTCPAEKGGHLCTATFSAPIAMNDIQVDSYGSGSSLLASGTFPIPVTASGGNAWAVLGGSIAQLEVIPFLGSSLPISQHEGAWIVANAGDANASVIIGPYQPPIQLSTSTFHMLVRPKTLNSSQDGERVQVLWHFGYLGNSYSGVVAKTSKVKPVTARIDPADDIVYFRASDDAVNFSPGPIVIGRDGNAYFAVNDATGCSGSPRQCAGWIGEFDTTHHTFSHTKIPLTQAAGVKRIYVDQNDGAIWFATYQTTGQKYGSLPVLRLAPGSFGSSGLATLPPDYDGASGFTQDSSGRIWISRCQGDCSGSGGVASVVATTEAEFSKPPSHRVTLRSCPSLSGSKPFNVGDIAFQPTSLYVIGQSVAPGSGTIWKISGLVHKSQKATCLTGLPAGFSPSLDFSGVNGTQIVGIRGKGGSNAHGFYKLANDKITTDTAPKGKASNLSAFNGLLYYVANGTDPTFKGLGTYQPSNGVWNVFPTVGFAESQFENGVAASQFGAASGAIFMGTGLCGGKQGICLGALVYANEGGHFGAIPGLPLDDTPQGEKTNFGVVTNPSPTPGSEQADLGPRNVHSGPFRAEAHNPTVCQLVYVAPFTFAVKGLAPGPCPITITNTDTGQVQPLVTNVH